MPTTHITTLQTYECWVCGVPFGLGWQLEQNLRRDGSTFFCPKGCRLAFGESKESRLQQEVTRKQAELDQAYAARDQARRDTARVEREKAAVKGHLTRAKRRISKGVCPCCNRSFANVRRHMASQHPQYAATSDAP